MADVGTSVASAFDHVWDWFLGRLDGLGDEEYFRRAEPAAVVEPDRCLVRSI
jgi:hypothetical protein